MSHGRAALRVVQASIAVSIVLALPLMVIYRAFDSQLALAQAADSFTDAFTAGAFFYSLKLAALPPDANHPRGHARAEPVAALVAAVLAGVLAFEVLREALAALYGSATPRIEWPLAAAFVVKIIAKAAIANRARHHQRLTPSPAFRAIEIDSRNDVLVCMLALGGFFAAHFGSTGWDAILAIPIAGWIAASGVSLANENIRLLMGEAAPAERHQALIAAADEVPGVRCTHDMIARYDGTHLDVSAHVVVDESLSVREAHDIAVAVERRLMAERDVLVAHVHVDVDEVERDHLSRDD
jgi:ferrous-iron efflux pump FieF